ncbi:MAG TPA: type VI secretion system tip protein VgrG, partial [Syntrophales bacterium]|nr:type VI secretion system tip protein VgrG [Syntrophales bacterium]
MEYLTSKKFSFVSVAFSADTFGVISFKGSEAISQPYGFEILLVSVELTIDHETVIQNPARLIIHRDDGDDVLYQGILLSFEQLHNFGGVVFYRAHLVPMLYWLSLTHHNQVILDKSLPNFLMDVLKDGGLTSLDFEFRLQETYLPVDFVCQYGESHLNFVSRWLEREGIYYFFEQTQSGEKVIFTDSRMTHTSMPQGKSVRYSPPSGLEALHLQEIISRFTCRYSLTPSTVIVSDYNDIKPSLDVTGKAEIDADGRGRFYSYGDHFLTPEEGQRMARIR